MRQSRRILVGSALGALALAAVLSSTSYAQAPEAPNAPKELPLQSLFFSDAEIAKIYEAMNVYRRGQGQNVDTFLDDQDIFDKAAEVKQLSTQGRFFTYPQFFLESLVFHSDIDWVIWVNGQKISNDSEDANTKLKVHAIDKDKVELEWAPSDMAQITRTAEKWPNEEITIDRLNGLVLFTLKPNQTFSSYVLRVLEGKVLPVIVESQSAAAANAPPTLPASTNATDLPTAPAAPTDEPVPFSPAPSSTLEDKAEEVIDLFEQKQ